MPGPASSSSIESQFTGTVSSVQSMTTGDQIRDAETQLKCGPQGLHDNSKRIAQGYNGTGKALAASVNASVMAQSATLQTLENTWWADRQTARMDEFAANDQRRTGVLSNLTTKGIDVSQAQAIENQIQQEGTVLNTALTSRDESAIKAANEQARNAQPGVHHYREGLPGCAHPPGDGNNDSYSGCYPVMGAPAFSFKKIPVIR